MFPFSHFGESIRTYIRSSVVNMGMGNNKKERKTGSYKFQVETKFFCHPPYFREITVIYFQMLPCPSPPLSPYMQEAEKNSEPQMSALVLNLALLSSPFWKKKFGTTYD